MSNAKAFTDSFGGSRVVKTACLAVSTVNIDLSGPVPMVDQVAMSTTGTPRRIFLVAQTDPAENGIYTTNGGLATRATDADTSGEFTTGMLVEVQRGTVLNFDSVWELRTTDSITLGTTPLVFEQVFGPGAGYALQQRVTALE